LQKLEAHLNSGKPANTLGLALAPEEKLIVRSFCLLTEKPAIIVANLKENELSSADSNANVLRVREYARTHHASETVVLCAQLESELADLSAAEAQEYLSALGIADSGLVALIQSAYRVLGLRTFFTFNEQEVRAWTVHSGDTAVKAAGIIHTDFERGFIKAEAVHWADLVQQGSVGRTRETGHYRIEGRDYVVRDGDVLLFKVSV
jgi:ribosome-binding ATPase YchF (GTP1/OBG family)